MKRIVPLLTVSCLISFLLLSACQSSSSGDSASEGKDTQNQIVSPQLLYGVAVDSMEVVEESIQANENLSEILSRYHVSQAMLSQLITVPKEVFDPRRLKANKPYTVIHHQDSLRTARSFIYHPNPIDYVAMHFEDSLIVERGQHPVDTIKHTLQGTILSSLYETITEAGGTPVLANELADVYGWEIDFFGIQAGDAFKVIYTTHEVQGEHAGFGEIMAASFTHMGREIFAFAYDQGEGTEYFDEAGNSLRKTFLKAPLKFSRISSRFSYSRLHPVLKIRRPHLGVDYAAPRGTPVQAVGDGVVIKAARSGGAGKMVKIRHNSNYTTAYLHLSGYGKDIRSGTSVKQGDIIGYVGSTGLSTGPHLDFRFYKNGVPVDPLKVDPPSSTPILPAHELPFMQVKEMMYAQLEAIRYDNASQMASLD